MFIYIKIIFWHDNLLLILKRHDGFHYFKYFFKKRIVLKEKKTMSFELIDTCVSLYNGVESREMM